MFFMSCQIGEEVHNLGYFDGKVSSAIQWCIDNNMVPRNVDYFIVKTINVRNTSQYDMVSTYKVFGEDDYNTFDNGSYEVTQIIKIEKLVTTEEQNAINAFNSLSDQEKEAVKRYLGVTK
ncbi:hypothetical protein ZPAH1_orf00356 [Aeromonas phage ZPAH1]|nr:hypothetical protein ASwh1_310 [Aeromonas phage Aswh_1]QQG34118.1 hypothetical protein ZPAH1_orf00356 [Aeromonas phage ZPAH1]